jgi:hypothetical protein
MSKLQERNEPHSNKNYNIKIQPISKNSIDDYMENNYLNNNPSVNAKYKTLINDNDNYQYDNINENSNVFSTRNSSHKHEFMSQINNDKSFSRITDRYNVNKQNKMTFDSRQKLRKKNLSVMSIDIENISKNLYKN